MSFRGMWRLLAAVSLVALASTGGAAASDEGRGIDPNQGRSLVELTLPSKAEAMQLQLDADQYGIEFNEHYLRKNPNGTVTVTVFGAEDELAALQDAGYELGVTIEGPDTWRERIAEWQAEVKAEKKADAAALSDVGIESHEDELVVLRVDYFESYAGRFLSVEAKTRLATVAANGAYTGPALSLSFNSGSGPIDSPPRAMSVNIDGDTTPDTYIEHRELVRIGDAGTTSPAPPTQIRIGSSTGESVEAPVNVWLGGGLPPMKDTLPEGLPDQVPGSDRGLPEAGRAGGRVPRHLRADHAAEQDERLPAEGDGEHERRDAARELTRGRHRAVADRRARLACLGARGRQRHHGRVP